MGQIRGKNAHIDACNLRSLSSFGTPAAGQHILVSTDNSATADGQGNFDAYVVGDGTTAATALKLKSVETLIGAFDISAYHATGDVLAKYADLAAALGTNGANVPAGVRRGGMSVKFVQSSDNKYVQYMYHGTSTAVADFTNGANWEKINLAKDFILLDQEINGTNYQGSLTFVNPAQLRLNDIFVPAGVPFNMVVASEDVSWTRMMVIANGGNGTGTTLKDGVVNGTTYEIPAQNVDITSLYVYIVSGFDGRGEVTVNVTSDNGLVNRIEQLQDSIGELDNDITEVENDVDSLNVTIYNKQGGTYTVNGYGTNYFGNFNFVKGKEYNFRIESTSQATLYVKIVDANNQSMGDNNQFSVFPATFTLTARNQDYVGAKLQLQNAGTNDYTITCTGGNGILVDIEDVREDLESETTRATSAENGLQDNIDAVSDEFLQVVDVTKYQSNNLINPNDEDVVSGKYISNSSGSLSNNGNYSVTGYIPVISSKTYYLSYSSGITVSSITALFYDNNKAPISASFVENASSFTAPTGAAYFRCTLISSVFSGYQVSEGSIKPYEEYYEPYNEYKINPKAVATPFSHFNSELSAVNAGNYLLLPSTHISKNNFLSLKIKGAFTSIQCGVGYSRSSQYYYRDYGTQYVVIDSTNVSEYRAYNDEPHVVSGPTAHDLTLTENTVVEMSFNYNGGSVTIYNDRGDSFTKTLQAGGVGRPFFYNDSSSVLYCDMSLFPRDLTKKIWVFGDSYMNFTIPERWPYYLAQKGYTEWLCNAQPGLAPATAVEELGNLLSLGYYPKYLVWTLGMNGNTGESKVDGQYVINDYQKTNIDAVVSVCKEKGIELILAIVPTVPERQKTGFGNYVKSLGVRVIDFAGAAGADEYGIWHNSPTLRKWVSGGNAVYTQILSTSTTVLATNGKNVFDVNGDIISGTVSNYNQTAQTIDVSGTTYTYDSDMVGLLSKDGVHSDIRGGKVLASQVLVDVPELTLKD